jgi:AcrR family transcriptional regulator
MHLNCNRSRSVTVRSHCYSGRVPRQVDHGARRRLIAEALWRVTRAEGLDAASLRQIATEAGVSMGLIQHYFDSKDEMLAFALETISERVSQRITSRLAALGETPEPSALVRAVLVEMLPLDEPRRLEAHVAFAFLARAAVAPGIAERLRGQYRQLLDFVTSQIQLGRRAGEALGPIEAALEAESMIALVDGLAAHTLAGLHDPESALEVFERRLEQVFDSVAS